ncbi:procollagen C-endopeptidase enhancer 2-like isoform X2 [Carassius auratus]|uniref:Procollagen C-endopeptidase enhancer 2-like isoform X2 n=1 Tax=Carassius auratus TaxID=7957 RepID=A0A6P6JSQ4_CARAU|nr:procollagen C-endopeptidase enhancer 2-like isoform X2 [Carassius auratus]
MRIIIWIIASTFLFSVIFTQRHRRPVFTCGGNLTGDTGLIGSQGYPGVYPPNNKCVWRITVPQGRVVSLLFRALDLESDSLCRYDFVDVYDGHINGQRLGRFCGTTKPGALVTNGNKMQVVMVSDANTDGSGFLAVYSAIRPNESAGDRYCGGLLDEPSGTIKTPNWPDKDYPAGVTCSWHIVAPQDQIIELKFEKFDVERDSYCRYDHVAVFNGGETNESRKIGKFCGDSPPMPISSDGNHLFILFLSDLSLTADGFIGHYLFKSRSFSTASAPLTPTSTVPPTTPPAALTYSEGLCKQKCKRTGTIESHYCSSNFVITATLISAAMRDHSVLATFSILHLYKEGSLAIQQAGKTMSTKVTVLCKKCPLVRRGLNYIVMGQTGEQGQGVVSPHNFVMAFKTKKQRDLGVLKNIRC